MGDLYYVLSVAGNQGRYIGYKMKQIELYANHLELLATFMFIEAETEIFHHQLYFVNGTGMLELLIDQLEDAEDVSEEYLQYAKEEMNEK